MYLTFDSSSNFSVKHLSSDEHFGNVVQQNYKAYMAMFSLVSPFTPLLTLVLVLVADKWHWAASQC